MTLALARFNALSLEDAAGELFKCCGSSRWAQGVSIERPFTSIEQLLITSDRIWQALAPADWLEAFSHHPRIGEKNSERPQTAQASRWSEEEQSGTREADAATMAALVSANQSYLQKFGYIFIVCATGKTSGEMLSLLEQRLPNDTETELRIAAEEQRRITHLRLRKLLASQESGV